MNQSIEAPAIQEFLVRHLAEIFSTMLSLPAVPQPHFVLGQTRERVSGSVGFVGEMVSGAVYLHVSVSFATHITGAMLGLPADECPGDADVNDVMGEDTNMMAGGLKSWLCDLGAACALSTPAIIRGTSFHIIASERVTQIQFGFASGAHQGLLEAHIKFIN